MVHHRLFGQDETAHRRDLGFDLRPEERNSGEERLNDTGAACRSDNHDTTGAAIRRQYRHLVDAKQHTFVRKLVKLDLTNSASASPAPSS